MRRHQLCAVLRVHPGRHAAQAIHRQSGRGAAGHRPRRAAPRVRHRCRRQRRARRWRPGHLPIAGARRARIARQDVQHAHFPQCQRSRHHPHPAEGMARRQSDRGACLRLRPEQAEALSGPRIHDAVQRVDGGVPAQAVETARHRLVLPAHRSRPGRRHAGAHAGFVRRRHVPAGKRRRHGALPPRRRHRAARYRHRPARAAHADARQRCAQQLGLPPGARGDG